MNVIRLRTLTAIIKAIVNYYYNLLLFDLKLLKFCSKKPISNIEQRANLEFFKIAADSE